MRRLSHKFSLNTMSNGRKLILINASWEQTQSAIIYRVVISMPGPKTFQTSTRPSSCHKSVHPGARQQDCNDEVGRGGRPKQRANIRTSYADVDKKDSSEQAQR
jgi:hypothetical protein